MQSDFMDKWEYNLPQHVTETDEWMSEWTPIITKPLKSIKINELYLNQNAVITTTQMASGDFNELPFHLKHTCNLVTIVQFPDYCILNIITLLLWHKEL